jgi:hypothetical protein
MIICFHLLHHDSYRLRFSCNLDLNSPRSTNHLFPEPPVAEFCHLPCIHLSLDIFVDPNMFPPVHLVKISPFKNCLIEVDFGITNILW